MAKSNWTVSSWNGSIWVADGNIYAPNEAFEDMLVSTQNKIPLADGDFGFVLPSTKYHEEPVKFIWLEIPYSDVAFKTKISNYVINATYLKITDSLSSTYIGRFTYLRRIWLLGVANTWDLEAGFERMSTT